MRIDGIPTWALVAFAFLFVPLVAVLTGRGAGQCSSGAKKKKRKKMDAESLHNFLTKDSVHVPHLAVGRPANHEEPTGPAHWKCPKCGDQFKSSAAYCYHYTTGEKFNVRPLLSCDPLPPLESRRACIKLARLHCCTHT